MRDWKKRQCLKLATYAKVASHEVMQLFSGELVQQIVFPTEIVNEKDEVLLESKSIEGFEEYCRGFWKLHPENLSIIMAQLHGCFGQTNDSGIWSLTLSDPFVSSDLPPLVDKGSYFKIAFAWYQFQSGLLTPKFGIALLKEVLTFKPYIGTVGEECPYVGGGILECAGKRFDLDINWITYYGTEFLEIVGRERIERLKGNVAHYEELPDGGILVCVVDELFSSDNPEHIEKLLNARKIVAFEEIATEIIEETEPEVIEFDPKDYKPDPDLD